MDIATGGSAWKKKSIDTAVFPQKIKLSMFVFIKNK